MTAGTPTILRLSEVSRSFGGVRAVADVSFEVPSGRVLGLIGPNGSGKTTLLNVVAGALAMDGGTMIFDGQQVGKWSAGRAARGGIGRAFQIPQAMDDLTVAENCMLGAMFGPSSLSQEESREVALASLERAGLDTPDVLAAELSFAHRKQLELARLLAMRPKLALVDEVMAGLSPEQTQLAERAIRALRDANVSVIIVEHAPGMIAKLADHIVVLHHGRVLAKGTPEEIMSDRGVVDAYLGRHYE